MANLNELEGLGEDAGFQVDYDNVPEQGVVYPPPPTPGTYRFKLPPDLTNLWETFPANIKAADGTAKELTRIRANFDAENPLLITQAQPNNVAFEKTTFYTKISNAERKRNKEGGMASDMQYLLRAFDENGPFNSNKDYAIALQRHAGEEFIADVDWAASCNPNKDVRGYDPEGNVVVVEGQPGCGQRVYQRDIPKDETGAYQETFPCPNCSFLLRAFPNLARFKKVS